MWTKKTIPFVMVAMAMLEFTPFRTAAAEKDESVANSTKGQSVPVSRQGEAVRTPIPREAAINEPALNTSEGGGHGRKEVVQQGVIIVYHKTTEELGAMSADQAPDEVAVTAPQKQSGSGAHPLPRGFSYRTMWQDPTRRASSMHKQAAWSYHPPSFKYHPKRFQGYHTRQDWTYHKPNRVGYRATRNWTYHRRYR